jgi:hypothetical protein
MAYTHDPASDEGLVRTLIFDKTSATTPVQGTDYQFEDEEITAVISQNSSDLWNAASDLCRALSAKYAAEAISLGLGKGDISLDLREKSRMYSQLSQQYQAKATTGGTAEYTDSFNYEISGAGIDISEYVGSD